MDVLDYVRLNPYYKQFLVLDMTKVKTPTMDTTQSDPASDDDFILITTSGARIGNSKENEVRLKKISISKFHAEIRYSEDRARYMIR